MDRPTHPAVERLQALWQKLNADPNAARVRKFEPDWLVIQWEQSGLSIVEARVSGGVTLKRIFELPWGGASNPEDSIASAASLLKDRLTAQKITTQQTAVIVGRDAVVVRRLDLPAAVDNDLPDMVRFQAATKASSPIDRLALDFIAQEADANSPRVAFVASMDTARLRVISEVITGAGLSLAAVGLSAATTAELASHSAPAGTMAGLSLVVFQKGEVVELSVLDAGRLTFAHSIRLDPSEGTPTITPLPAELNRALVAQSQSRPNAEITRVFLVPGPSANPAINDLLEKRFPGKVQRVDPRDFVQSTGLSAEESTLAIRCAPAIGQLLAVEKPRLPAIDFINPRKRIDPPDTRKAKIKMAAVAAVFISLIGIWMNMSAVSDRETQLANLESQTADANDTIKKGEKTSEAADRLDKWVQSNPRPQASLARLTELLPPPSQMLLAELKIKPVLGSTQNTQPVVANIKAVCWAKSLETLEAFQNRLVANHYRIEAYSPQKNLGDPDYPIYFELTADQLVPPKPAPKPAPAAAVSQTP